MKQLRTDTQAWQLGKGASILTYEQAIELTRGDIILVLVKRKTGWGLQRYTILRTYASKRWHWVKLHVFGLSDIQVWRSKPMRGMFLGVTSNRHK